MSATLHWFLPTGGDSRDIVGAGPDAHRRDPTVEYLGQVARTAEQLGFTGVLTPTGTWCEDAWLTTAALIRETSRLKFLVAFRPGAVSPTLAAQMAATFQRLSAGLLLLNVVTGGDAVEQQRFGDWLDHDERYDRTDESILSGHPHVEEVFWFGEHVIPRLRRAEIVAGEEPSTLRRPFALTMSAAR